MISMQEHTHKNHVRFGVLFAAGVFVMAVVCGAMFMQASAQESNVEMEGIEGIHIMADGTVMLGNGETLPDATVTEDGMIELPDGRIIEPVMDMREGGSMEDMEMDSGSINRSSIESIGEEGMAGIHIMPNGVVMTGTGETVEDATVTEDGMIELGSGDMVEPVMDMRGGEGIARDENSMVVNENTDRLPVGCDAISGEQHVTITGGVENAQDFPGTVFTYDQHEIDVAPCTLLTITFVNEDHVRHQLMVHDLPRDTYTMGMFNIEVTGSGRATGTFITPPDRETLLFHCGVPGHEEKGMVGQVKINGGDGDLPNVPGITRHTADVISGDVVPIGTAVAVVLLGAGVVFVARRRNTM